MYEDEDSDIGSESHYDRKGGDKSDEGHEVDSKGRECPEGSNDDRDGHIRSADITLLEIESVLKRNKSPIVIIQSKIQDAAYRSKERDTRKGERPLYNKKITTDY